MSAANFETQKDFDLWVVDFSFPVYAMDEDGEIDENRIIDYDYDYYLAGEVKGELAKVNKTFRYYQIKLQDGYYSETQFIVRTAGGDTEYPSDYTAEEWNAARKSEKERHGGYYSYDLPYSQALRQEQGEIMRVNQAMAEIGKKYGFEHLVCIGVFSNGGAVYERAKATA